MIPVKVVDCRQSYGPEETGALKAGNASGTLVLQLWKYNDDRRVFEISVLGVSGVEFDTHVVQTVAMALVSETSPRGWTRVTGLTPHLISIRPVDSNAGDRVVGITRAALASHPGLGRQWRARYGEPPSPDATADAAPQSPDSPESQHAVGGTDNG